MVPRLIVLVSVALLLSGCASASNCAGWSKLSISRKDTAVTKDLVTKHNNFGRQQGCW